MPIPVESVGSLPRPMKLQEAVAKLDKGEVSFEDVQKLQDDACIDSMKRFAETGSPFISDGEQRASSFATYPLADTLGGTGLADGLAPGGNYFAIFDDGHHRQLPRLVKGPFKYKTYAYDYLKKSMAQAPEGVKFKQAVIAPSMLSLLYPFDTTVEGYTKEQFYDDLVNECEKDIRGCFAAGAKRVSMDFTEGRLACKNDSRNPWTGMKKLQEFVELCNRVLDRFDEKERKDIGVHTCPGGDCDSVHSAEVDYKELLPSLFKLNAGYFLVQCASEKDKEHVYKLCGQHAQPFQTVFIGVINPLNPTVETPQQVCDDLVNAAKHIPKDRLGATDDCGFSPFSIDVKPKHGSPDVARDIAFQKIKARIEGARMASNKLGLNET